MKQTIDLHAFRRAFQDYNRMDNFSWEGLELLFYYCEECSPEMELDVIGLCCDYCEDTPENIAENYSIDIEGLDDDEEISDAVLDYLTERTSVVGQTSSGDIIYAVF